MNTSTFPSPAQQMKLHYLSLLEEWRHRRALHAVFHLKGIFRAIKQLLQENL